jgi:hypothetical protein
MLLRLSVKNGYSKKIGFQCREKAKTAVGNAMPGKAKHAAKTAAKKVVRKAAAKKAPAAEVAKKVAKKSHCMDCFAFQ